MQVCTTAPANGGRHYQSRGVARGWQRLRKWRREVAGRRHTPSERQLPPGLQERLNTLRGAAADSIAPPTPEELSTLASTLRREMRIMDRVEERRNMQAQKKAFQRLLRERPKVGNRRATGATNQTPSDALKVMRDPDTGATLTDSDDIKSMIFRQMSKLTKAPGGTKNGRYLPGEVKRNYPFATQGATDTFTLHQPDAAQRSWLHEHIADRIAFNDCVTTLAHGKAPGPDGVVNEVIQALPRVAMDALHLLFQLMWAAGHTPDAWKESVTALLYKKGDSLLLPNYRRVGLEMALYKLYTKLITCTLIDYTERTGMLSTNQWGFRPKRGTIQALEMLVYALEDAKLFRKDLYLLMIDFTAAFDTIDQDKLLIIMYDLGYPTDAIEVVKDLYAGAATCFRTPGGSTPTLKVDRGTIQGDGLSPLLFAIYLEPLLRWLQVGGRGYVPSCLSRDGYSASDAVKDQIPTDTYADDLNIATEKKDDLATQLHKVSHYAIWGELQVSMPKSAATAVLHRSSPQDPTNAAMVARQLNNLLHVAMADGSKRPIKVVSPKEPFTFLGVTLTVDLNFRHHVTALAAKMRKKAAALAASMASSSQKLRIIDTCLRPAMAYGTDLAICPLSQLTTLQSVLNTATKRAYGVMASAPNALTQTPRAAGGMGCHSIAVDAATRATERLVRNLNDTGRTGRISRALLRAQLDMAAGKGRGLVGHRPPWLMQYAMGLRRLEAAHQTGLEIVKETIAQTGDGNLMRALDRWVASAKKREYATASPTALQDMAAAFAPELAKLWEVGVDDLNRLILPSTTGGQATVRPLSGITLAPGVKMQRHHKAALARLTRLLHSADSADKRLPRTLKIGADLPVHERTIDGPLWDRLVAAGWVMPSNAHTITAYFSPAGSQTPTLRCPLTHLPLAAWDGAVKQRMESARANALAAYRDSFALGPKELPCERGFPPQMPLYFRHTSAFRHHDHVRALMRVRCCSTPFAACPTLHTGAPTVCRHCPAAAESAAHVLLDCPAYAALRASAPFSSLFPTAPSAPAPAPARLHALVRVPDQYTLGAFVHACFEQRARLLSDLESA